MLQYQADYERAGFTVLRDMISIPTADRWRAAFESAFESGHGHSVDVADERGETASGIGGRLRYDLLDGIQCERLLPDMIQRYEQLTSTLSIITRQKIIVSPYPRSKVCGKGYPVNGGQQGWHFDTNGVTVIVYLTSNADGQTVMISLDEENVSVAPRSGSILLMQGRKVWHCGAPVKEKPKLISCWNYYVDGDTWRPEGIDDQIYGPTK